MVYLHRRPLLQDAALVHDDHLAAHDQGLERLGGGVDHGGLLPGEQVAQLGAQLLAQLVVEVDQGLVEQEQRRALDQGAGDGEALLLAARQLGGHAVEQVVDVQHPGGVAHLAVDLGRGRRPAGAAGRRCCRRR